MEKRKHNLHKRISLAFCDLRASFRLAVKYRELHYLLVGLVEIDNQIIGVNLARIKNNSIELAIITT